VVLTNKNEGFTVTEQAFFLLHSQHVLVQIVYHEVSATGNYDGEISGMIGRGNRTTRRKPAPVPPCPPQTPYACPDANLGRRGGKPATNRLSYSVA
jgi:hypothetical protein